MTKSRCRSAFESKLGSPNENVALKKDERNICLGEMFWDKHRRLYGVLELLGSH